LTLIKNLILTSAILSHTLITTIHRLTMT